MNTCRRWISVAGLLAGLGLTESMLAQEITRFDNGYLTFRNENPALYYRVEFKPNLTGFAEWDGSYRGLRNIRSAEPEVTVPVGVFYRVVGRAEPYVAGTATAADILSGKTAYVNDEEVTGTMPQRTGHFIAQSSTVKNTALQFRPQAGYYDGAANNSVYLSDADFTAGNIKAGVNIFGISGILVEAAGEAKEESVLEGETYSRTGEAGLTGTMPNRTKHVTAQSSSFYKSALRFRPQAGYYSGIEGNSVELSDVNFLPENIKSGVSIFGLAGEAVEATGSASTTQVLSGATFSRAGEAGLTGTMPNRGAVNVTPSTTAQSILAGYHNGSGSVAGDPDLVAGSIKAGVNIFGVSGSVVEALGAATAGQVISGATFSRAGAAGLTGTMPNRGTVNITPGTTAQTIQQGYHTGSGSVAGNANLVAGNIKSGVSIFGVTGTYAASTSIPCMVGIPGGTNAGTDPDIGAYSLAVGPFSMDCTPVTKAQWDEVYNWAITHGYTFSNAGLGKAPDHPVVNVNWYDCVKWCNARSEKEGRTPVYRVGGNVYRTGEDIPIQDTTTNGYRLPTTNEHMYASRGGLVGKRFPWGDTVSHQHANYQASPDGTYSYEEAQGYSDYTLHPTYDVGSSPKTSPVKAFTPNGYGLYDMAGNTRAWCWDRSGTSATNRFFRAGSWYSVAPALRCHQLSETPASARDYLLGFRAVCR